MSEDRFYLDQNTQERERLRALVERLDEDELRMPVNEYWTVAAVFGHIAFWDARVLALADKLERGVPFSPSDAEPEDVDWINDASRPLIHAIPPLEVAQLTIRIAEETDARVGRCRSTASGRATRTARSTRCAHRTGASTSTTSRRRSGPAPDRRAATRHSCKRRPAPLSPSAHDPLGSVSRPCAP
jgi:hypothetical protein